MNTSNTSILEEGRKEGRRGEGRERGREEGRWGGGRGSILTGVPPTVS